jgi:hypothetical protein
VIARYPAAESVLIHRALDLAPQLVVAPAGDHALAAATVHPQKLAAVLVSLRLLVRLLHRALAIAPLQGHDLYRVQTTKATRLHGLLMAGRSLRDELVRLACLPQPAKGTPVARLLVALP